MYAVGGGMGGNRSDAAGGEPHLAAHGGAPLAADVDVPELALALDGGVVLPCTAR